jgi:asparagine synthase (glutamine-hydrolysing)
VRFFVCLLDRDGGDVPDTARRSYEKLPHTRGLAFKWHRIGKVAVLAAGNDAYDDPLIAINGSHVAVGTVRLDNRGDLERSSGCGNGLTDLELVLHAVVHCGPEHVSRFLGDFAFVVWNPITRTGVAACDTFAVKKLYYAERGGVLAFASRAEAIAREDDYETQSLAELVAMCSASPELTVYAGVRAVPAARVALMRGRAITLHQYWSPASFEPEPHRAKSDRDAASECRDLLADSVRLRLSSTGTTWAQLSGGMDSSSVVSVVEWLVERGEIARGLSGTVTYVDRQGTTADEREYSNAVATRWRLRNEAIIDPPVWLDDEHPLPRTDQPRFAVNFYPRERRLCSIVRGAGARVLLTGVAGDSLFTGTMLFFADWLARGRVWPAVREMARWAKIGRVSFWELAYRNGLLPLLPRAMQRILLRDDAQVPAWILPTAMRRYGLRKHGFVAATYGGRMGHKYHHAIVTNVAEQGTAGEFGIVGEELDVRHPFLHRPLVEFALRLPPELCARPHARKWLLREAMDGILPEAVRRRVGKGGPEELYASSLTTHRTLLAPLLREPILAELGVIDPTKLRTAFDAAAHQPRRRDQFHAVIQSTLMVEAWLQIRSGRWPAEDRRGSTVSH